MILKSKSRFFFFSLFFFHSYYLSSHNYGNIYINDLLDKKSYIPTPSLFHRRNVTIIIIEYYSLYNKRYYTAFTTHGRLLLSISSSSRLPPPSLFQATVCLSTCPFNSCKALDRDHCYSQREIEKK
jgi:hypothetical protein